MNTFYIFSIFGWVLLGLAHVNFVTLARTVPELASELGPYAPYETWYSGIFYLIWIVAWHFKHKIALWRRPLLKLLFFVNLVIWLKQLTRMFWLFSYFQDFKPYLLCASVAISSGFTLFLLMYVTFEVVNQMARNTASSEAQIRKAIRLKLIAWCIGGAAIAGTLLVKGASFADGMTALSTYIPLSLAFLFVGEPKLGFARKK